MNRVSRNSLLSAAKMRSHVFSVASYRWQLKWHGSSRHQWHEWSKCNWCSRHHSSWRRWRQASRTASVHDCTDNNPLLLMHILQHNTRRKNWQNKKNINDKHKKYEKNARNHEDRLMFYSTSLVYDSEDSSKKQYLSLELNGDILWKWNGACNTKQKATRLINMNC